MALLDDFRSRRDYPLDEFQVAACEAISAGKGALVCAPTGSGKTVIGEFTIETALDAGTSCFYTTPIKALSNQKYHDFVDRYGAATVGLLTGDQVINQGAPVTVMTTEVLRNMIYARSPELDRLSHVVMDEVHYLADRSRGSVWEEVILGLADHVSVVGLSATVSNAEEFGAWLSTVRGETEVIVSEERPVPLHQWMLVGRSLYPLFRPATQAETSSAAFEPETNPSLVRAAERASLPTAAASGTRRTWNASGPPRGTRPARRPRAESRRPHVLRTLAGRGMLPAIIFVFSRNGCDQALLQCLRSSLVLTDDEERHRIAMIVDSAVSDIPAEDLDVLDFTRWRAALLKGCAAHHAGMLPAFRHIVEELFVEGLLKAVFATETLALGINMPARSVVLERLVKFNGDTHTDLTPGEYTQLTGRAGRRGIDTEGHAVVLHSPGIDPREVTGLASVRTYPLVSTFRPGYNMSINLLAAHGRDRAIELLEMSFAQFQANRSVVSESRRLDRATRRLREAEEALREGLRDLGVAESVAEVIEFADLRHRLSRAEKKQESAARDRMLANTHSRLAAAQAGEVLAIPRGKRTELVCVVAAADRTDDPRPLVVGESGWKGRLSAEKLGREPVTIGRMRVAGGRRHRGINARRVADDLRHGGFRKPKKLRSARVAPTADILALRRELRAHPVHDWPVATREAAMRMAHEVVRARRTVEKNRATTRNNEDTLARTFGRILDLLGELDYVEGDRVTEEGSRLARIHGTRDLLVGQCLKRGIWDGLDPAELAGVASLCTFENRKEAPGQPGAATDAMEEAMRATVRIWSELSRDEHRHHLPTTPEPEPAFALAMHQWTAGAPLGYCLAAANECGAALGPGDFVRWCRQVIDLLGQIAATGYTEEIVHHAHQAIEAIRRGVVAIAH